MLFLFAICFLYFNSSTAYRSTSLVYQKSIVDSRKASKLPYDKLYHLSLIATLKNGKNVLIEKNEVINFEMTGVRDNAESKMVRLNGKKLTLNILMANTKKYMGSKFLPYSSYFVRKYE